MNDINSPGLTENVVNPINKILQTLICINGNAAHRLKLKGWACFVSKVKLSPFSRGRPEGSLFNSYYTYYSRGGRYSFPWIAPLYPWYIPYIAECRARRYQVPFFESLVWLDLGLNPGLLGHWRKLYPLGQGSSRKCLNVLKQLRWLFHN